MKDCRFCGKALKEENAICSICGYDPKTDTINQEYKYQEDLIVKSVRIKEGKADKSKKGIKPSIVIFAFLSVALALFSIFYKYNFDFKKATSEIKGLLSFKKQGKKSVQKSSNAKEGPAKEAGLITARNFDGTKKAGKGIVVEGIFFDPNVKSFIIINGKVLSEGDSFGKVTVKKINIDSVEVSISGTVKVARVNQDIEQIDNSDNKVGEGAPVLSK